MSDFNVSEVHGITMNGFGVQTATSRTSAVVSQLGDTYESSIGRTYESLKATGRASLEATRITAAQKVRFEAESGHRPRLCGLVSSFNR